MPIPDFQSIMLPLLRSMSDGAEHTNKEVLETLSQGFGLAPEESKARLASGADYVFRNRVAWARAHMKGAALLENPRRGVAKITAAGRRLLETAPTAIEIKTLRQYPAYREWIKPKSAPKPESAPSDRADDDIEATKTPYERIEESFEILTDALSELILEQLRSASPTFFEKVVIEVLVKMGYGGSRRDASERLGGTGDEGIDGTIKEDRLGLDIIYVQAKKWEATIPRPEIQRFVGALHGKHARKGVFITTSTFSQGARDYAETIDSKVILIDGRTLAQFMIDYNVGVSTEAVYEVKRLDSDYFEDA